MVGTDFAYQHEKHHWIVKFSTISHDFSKKLNLNY